MTQVSRIETEEQYSALSVRYRVARFFLDTDPGAADLQMYKQMAAALREYEARTGRARDD